jgi:hypothetical protein
VCVGLCMTPLSSFNTMIRSSPACSRKKKEKKNPCCNHLVNCELLYAPFQNVGRLNFVLSQTSLILTKLIEKYVNI